MGKTKVAIIAGAGPAGLTAAVELLRQTDVHPIVLEMSDTVGGISKTINYHGNRMDLGGHRFFSKSKVVMDWWNGLMPIQGAPAYDDVLLDNHKSFVPQGPNPAETDRVMLIRERVSHIFFLRKFFDYPISIKWRTFANMGFVRTFKVVCGYLYAMVAKRPETSLENFYINRFGKPLYSLFFEDYTEKVWGVHPRDLGADWGAQRVKGLSIMSILKDILTKPFRSKTIDQQKVETSLIEQFIYPKYGPGQLWENAACEVERLGGEVRTNSKVVGVRIEQQRVVAVDVENNGVVTTEQCDYFFSSMPLKDLVTALRGCVVPDEVQHVADELPYRDFITVGLLVKQLNIANTTKIHTFDNRVPDTWIYVQERDVKVGRLQIFNNWSPYMVADYEHTMFVGLEYFCTEGDALWSMDKDAFINMAIDEMERIHILNRADVLDATQVKVQKAYPAYFGSYYSLDCVKHFLDGMPNLYCIGRNGQHRYNNMDHSMLTAMEAVKNIVEGRVDKANVWSVNTEESYHETK